MKEERIKTAPSYLSRREVTMPGINVVRESQQLAIPIAEKLGLSIWDVEFKKEGTSWYLRIFIDKPDGIDINDCEALYREMDALLDEHDFIAQQYIFEVSSPGLERVLRKDAHYEACIGETVELKLYQARNGTKVIPGILKAYDHGQVTLETPKGELTFEKSEISTAKTTINWAEV